MLLPSEGGSTTLSVTDDDQWQGGDAPICGVSFGKSGQYCTGPLCLSEIKSGHIRDAIRRGPGRKEYALPSLQCAIGAVCTENLIRVDDVMESPKLAE